MKNKPSVAIPNDLKLINQKTILNVFIEGKKYTINDITETTGISNQTVQKGIQHFVNQNLLVSAGKGEPAIRAAGGRSTSCCRPICIFFA
jgi:Fic family protein